MQTTLRHWEYYGTTELFTNLYEESKMGKKFHNLYEKIISEENILLAYRTIKSNKGSKTAGTDKFTIDHYKSLRREDFISLIKNTLKNYKPNKVKRKMIPKSNGDFRPLGIPTMRDRLIQQMFKQILEPICEAKFYEHNYGFRPVRDQEQAISRSMYLINIQKYHFTVDVDIKGFFDNVNHRKLLKQIWNIGISDKRVIAVISKMLKAPIKGEGIPSKGVPQGGILSPLLSNIVLNDLDQWVAGQYETFTFPKQKSKLRSNRYSMLTRTNLKRGFIVRFADDFKIFARDSKSAWKWFHAVRGYLNDHLKLDIAPEKSKVINLRKRSTEFLGFKLTLMKKESKLVVKSNIRPKKLQAIQVEAKQRIKDIQRDPKRYNVERWNSFVLGLQNYFKFATHVYKDLDRLAYKLSRTMHNRLRSVARYKRPTTMPEVYKKRYGSLKRKTFIIKNIPLFPIVAQEFSKPFNKKQEETPYTEEGRLMLHKNLAPNVYNELQKLATSKIPHRTMEYMDNRLSRYSMSGGNCEITGIFLCADQVHCHHSLPVSLGGEDDYNNLRIVHRSIHMLIHATKQETIVKLLNEFKLTKKQLEKLNYYREKCNLERILKKKIGKVI